MLKKYLSLASLFVFINLGLVFLSWQTILPFVSPIFLALFFILLIIPAFLWSREFFWFFLSTVALENVFLTGESFPVSLRFFQLAAVALFVGWALRKFFPKKDFLSEKFLEKKSKEKKEKFPFLEWATFSWVAIFSLGGLVAEADRENVKWTLIVASFVFLFFLAGKFLKTRQEKAEGLFFFLVGSATVWLVGGYQALANRFGWEGHLAMEERINATFLEPDWLGIYWSFCLGLLLGLKLFFFHWKNGKRLFFGKTKLPIFLSRVLNIKIFFVGMMLALTVSRSAWLATVVVLAVYIFWQWRGEVDKRYSWRTLFQGFKEGLTVGAFLILAFVLVRGLGLSNFDFFNRATSTVSGEQKITISCQKEVFLPEKIEKLEQLDFLGCRHINLEEIESEKAAGFFIGTVNRPDPNVNLRKEIYGRTWQEIKKHPWLGQGWGASAKILGQDENGNGLNASNIFLEIWLSAGLLGLSGFLLVLFLALREIFRMPSAVAGIFLFSGTAYLVANFFNAGIFSGFFWIFLAAFNFKPKE